MILLALFYTGQSSASNSVTVREVLSIKTGNGPNNIGNQFVHIRLEPFNGFAVDSKVNILISDTMNHRIMRFSKEGKLLDRFTVDNTSPFLPESLCLIEDDVIYVHDTEKHEIIVFSSSGKVLRSYSPGSVFENEKKRVPVISLTCSKTTIKVVFGVDKIKRISPVYLDEYDQQFKLIDRKLFDDQVDYYNGLEETNKVFEKHFEDSKGNMYGYPIVKDWYGKFLPLQKYSPTGVLLSTIDGKLLTKNTKYKVYDYYTTTQNIDWIDMKGRDCMIVNWYVTPSGIIYALIANTDYVKVLQIEENKKTTH
jgi:hypothetical protein